MLTEDREKIKEMVREMGSIINRITDPEVLEALEDARAATKEVIILLDAIDEDEEDDE